MARVNAHSDDPIRVAQAAPSQQDLVRVDTQFSSVRQREIALEFIKVLVGPLTVDCRAVKVSQRILLCLGQSDYGFVRLLVLEVGLAVQVLRLNVGDTLWERAI